MIDICLINPQLELGLPRNGRFTHNIIYEHFWMTNKCFKPLDGTGSALSGTLAIYWNFGGQLWAFPWRSFWWILMHHSGLRVLHVLTFSSFFSTTQHTFPAFSRISPSFLHAKKPERDNLSTVFGQASHPTTFFARTVERPEARHGHEGKLAVASARKMQQRRLNIINCWYVYNLIYI